MARYARIQSAAFGSTDLPLPVSVRICRQAEPNAAAGDGDLYATSVQIGPGRTTAELRIRGTATAESLALGRQDNLKITLAPGQDGAPLREVRLIDAVLVAVELAYEQTAMATAILRFVAEANNGLTEPVTAEDA